MKTLYESILSSTKSGAATILEQWCKENLDNEDIWHSNEYEIKNGVIHIKRNALFLDLVKEKVPSCVQFEKDTKIDIYSAQSLPFFEPKQLPEKLNSLYFDGSIETLPSLDMDLYSLVLSGNESNFKHIKPSTFVIYENGKIDFRRSKIETSELQNLTIKSKVNNYVLIQLQGTPAGRDIYDMCNTKLKWKPLKYLAKVFKTFPDIIMIELKPTAKELNTIIYYKKDNTYRWLTT